MVRTQRDAAEEMRAWVAEQKAKYGITQQFWGVGNPVYRPYIQVVPDYFAYHVSVRPDGDAIDGRYIHRSFRWG